jgi:DNA (cytosine-5)-methyltransferase 1
MSRRIHRHLELYCCEGASGVGYGRASNDEVEVRVYGVDLFEDYTQARCPFPTAKADAIKVLEHLLAGGKIVFTGHRRTGVGATETYKVALGLEDFDSIGASPPCQHASAGTRAQDRSKYPRLIEPTRDLLVRIAAEYGIPYVIENVKGADLIDPIMLCGRMLGLGAIDEDGVYLVLDRHRLFESNLPLVAPPHPEHTDVPVGGVYGGGRRAKRREGESLAEVAPRDRYEAKYVRKGGYTPRSRRVQQELLGVDWMTVKGMQQCIPPAYTAYLGRQILAAHTPR